MLQLKRLGAPFSSKGHACGRIGFPPSTGITLPWLSVDMLCDAVRATLPSAGGIDGAGMTSVRFRLAGFDALAAFSQVGRGLWDLANWRAGCLHGRDSE